MGGQVESHRRAEGLCVLLERDVPILPLKAADSTAWGHAPQRAGPLQGCKPITQPFRNLGLTP